MKFLVLHHASVPARKMMADTAPEQKKASWERWQAWASKLQGVTVEFGSPLEEGGTAGPAGIAAHDVVGYSIMGAESAEALKAAIADHPHLDSPGGWLEVFGFVPMSAPAP